MPRYELGQVLMGRLERGDDILEALTRVARDAGVATGWVQLLGAVERAHLAFYDQQDRVYKDLFVEEPCEILHGVGNVSQLEGDLFVHLHLTLGDAQGRAMGGHVLAGTRVFACEYVIWPLKGPELVRYPDEATGLKLWPAERAGRSEGSEGGR